MQCIYKAQKTGKKTNRCQKVNVEKLFNKLLQTRINLITYWTYPKRLRNTQSPKRESKSRAKHKH